MVSFFLGPKDRLFVRLQEAWHILGHQENDLTTWDWPADPRDYRHERAREVRVWLEDMMRHGVFARNRDDYRELMECAAVYLGAQVRTNLVPTLYRDNISFLSNALFTCSTILS